MDSYALWKTLHVTSAVLIVGNVTVTGFWAYFLYRQRGAVGFRAIARGIMLSDILFTVVGGAGLTITGILMVRAQQVSITDTPWLLRGVLRLFTRWSVLGWASTVLLFVGLWSMVMKR